MGHHRLGAVRAGPHGDSQLVEDHPDIVRMRPVDRKRQDTALVELRAVDTQALHGRELLGRIGRQSALVTSRSLAVHAFHVADRLAEPDRADVVGRAGLELERKLGIGRSGERDRRHHVAPAHERRHPFQPPFLAVQHADPRRTVELVTGKGIEVAIERRHVDSAVHDPLTTVDEYRHALAVRRIDDRAQVGPRPEHV